MAFVVLPPALINLLCIFIKFLEYEKLGSLFLTASLILPSYKERDIEAVS